MAYEYGGDRALDYFPCRYGQSKLLFRGPRRKLEGNYISVLGGTATGSFLGKIKIARDAQRIDAEQSVKSMLLDRGATANAKPELEIFADDVKCAHGATVGELDKQALFYMASRGLDPVRAKQLMLQAFVADAFVNLDGGADDAEQGALKALEALL